MPKASDPKPTIVLEDVVKEFELKHSRSLKESFVSLFKRKQPKPRAFRALDGVSFEVGEGESLAVLGRNGSGKSTTLKLISGVMLPDEGWVRTRGRVAGLLEVGAGFHPDLTGRDNIYLNAAILGMSKAEIDEHYDEIIEFSGIEEQFLDTEVKRYSSGMKSRLGFAVAVHTKLDVLLVDEVLSVGDASFKEKCTNKILEMRDQGKTMFVVSHNANQVRRLCERGVVLDRGRIIFDGPINDALAVLQTEPTEQFASPSGEMISVLGAIREAYDRNPRKYGRPLAEEETIEGKRGGVFQEFETGIIMVRAGRDRAGWITDGPFLRAYRMSGGPAGPWGMMTGKTQGSPDNGGTTTLKFRNGVASYNDFTGVHFKENGS